MTSCAGELMLCNILFPSHIDRGHRRWYLNGPRAGTWQIVDKVDYCLLGRL